MAGTQRLVASGRFPEGPTSLGGGAFAVVEMQGEALARVDADGTVGSLADLGGGPNGSTLGSDGAVYVANNGGLSARDRPGARRPGAGPRDRRSRAARVLSDEDRGLQGARALRAPRRAPEECERQGVET